MGVTEATTGDGDEEEVCGGRVCCLMSVVAAETHEL